MTAILRRDVLLGTKPPAAVSPRRVPLAAALQEMGASKNAHHNPPDPASNAPGSANDKEFAA